VLGGGLADLLGVLVGPGQEEHVPPDQPLGPGGDVRERVV
jgi:hypothetical protein